MRNIISASLVAGAALVGGDVADAATYITDVSRTGCSQFQNSEGPNTSLCFATNDYSARALATATDGSLQVVATSLFARDPSGRLVQAVDSSAFASVRDTLTFGLDTGTFRLTYDILGYQRFFDESRSGRARTTFRADIAMGDDPVYDLDVSLEGGSGGAETGFNRVDEVGTVEATFTGGSLDVSLSAFTDAVCTSLLSSGQTCASSSIFGSSLRLTGGEVLDESGNVVTNGFTGSDSGFDYIAGVAPHDRAAVVPLPASMWTLLAALGLVAGIRARRTAA